MNGRTLLQRILERELDGIDEVVDHPDDWADPHGIPRPRIHEDGPVIDGFFDREYRDE